MKKTVEIPALTAFAFPETLRSTKTSRTIRMNQYNNVGGFPVGYDGNP